MHYIDESQLTKIFRKCWNLKHFIHENGLFISITDSKVGYSFSKFVYE